MSGTGDYIALPTAAARLDDEEQDEVYPPHHTPAPRPSTSRFTLSSFLLGISLALALWLAFKLGQQGSSASSTLSESLFSQNRAPRWVEIAPNRWAMRGREKEGLEALQREKERAKEQQGWAPLGGGKEKERLSRARRWDEDDGEELVD